MSAPAVEQRRGDECPPWCVDTSLHVEYGLRDEHPDHDDNAVEHQRVVDAWRPVDFMGRPEDEECVVRMRLLRFDDGTDFGARHEAARVEVEGCGGDFLGGVSMYADDVERLGLALIKAAAMARVRD